MIKPISALHKIKNHCLNEADRIGKQWDENASDIEKGENLGKRIGYLELHEYVSSCLKELEES